MAASKDQKVKVTLLYDLISPWSYIALCLLKRYEHKWNLDIVLQPVSLGYLFQAAGNRAPLFVQNKGKMMVRHLSSASGESMYCLNFLGPPWLQSQEFRMFSDYYQIPTSSSAWTYSAEARNGPPNSLPLMRIILLLAEERPQLLETCTVRLFHRIFAEGDSTVFIAGKDVEKDTDKLLSVLGPDTIHAKILGDLWQRANGKEAKDRIKAEAARFVKDFNAYGVPWMRFEKPEGATRDFMGSDRFELIADWLGQPYQAGKLNSAGWEHSKL